MDIHDYEAEALRQLNDESNYAQLATPVSERTEAWVTNIIEDMHGKDELDHTTYLYLRDRAELRTPQFYMLPKIHKPDHPGRPILSANDGPTERISKYLDYFLRPIAAHSTQAIS